MRWKYCSFSCWKQEGKKKTNEVACIDEQVNSLFVFDNEENIFGCESKREQFQRPTFGRKHLPIRPKNISESNCVL